MEFNVNCCNSLKKAVDQPQSLFRTEDDGILRLAIWVVPLADGGRAFYEKAIIFCPFCGTQIQEKDLG
jgi:hypothetical protein